ncbi:hypothetical protein [Ornithinibacillus halophilus]|uniref:Uncharacterized protein n=1 Tax=Ornithinibacillus halophilus TaxID=930117 RepID=A0A1M5GLG9_9BACI|nr:hypothetical protein [Ornithinibacillus halophilus]SHG04538.1 hypothetical protein SAMN05216225_101360 [Ornithinibacillus halophilus]
MALYIKGCLFLFSLFGATSRILSQSDEGIVDTLMEILENGENLELRFRAFFGVTLYHRRQNNHSAFKRIVDKYVGEFQNFSLHYHVLSLMYKQFGDREGIMKSIKYGRLAVDKLNRHVGVD